MAFKAEDGTGLSDANGYIDAAFFKEYHDDRGRSYNDPDTGNPYPDAELQKAIVVASDFIDAKFRFVGMRKKTTQSMEWPRWDAYYWDGRVARDVPAEVKECVAELALKQLSSDIAPDPTYHESNRPVISERETVGPIETSTQFVQGGVPPVEFRAYPFAEKKLKELIITGVRVERI